jgi:hypothetical protein
LTDQIVSLSEAAATTSGRPFRYLPVGTRGKEEMAREILAESPVTEGLICVLKCVETCKTFEIHRSREHKKLELRPKIGKCSHLYHYFLHPRFGFMHVRLQTWLPFQVQVVINGREWLACELELHGVPYGRRDNSIVWVDDVEIAQRLLAAQMRTRWPTLLDQVAALANPAHEQLFAQDHLPRYWTSHQIEWATDVLFDRPGSLEALYPDLALHAICRFGSRDVLRFLQKKLTGHFAGDVTSTLKQRPEGLCVKHFVNSNSIKMYDKQGSVLRIETTLNRVRDLKVFRKPEPRGKPRWQPARKSVADLHRATQVCQQANEAYLEALAVADTSKKLGEVVTGITRTVRYKGRNARGLRPWSGADLDLLRAVNRGEFLLHGFRNRDIASGLFGSTRDPAERRRRSAATGRLLRLLRAHGIIRKLSRTHRYRVTTRGRELIAAVIAAHDARVSSLLKAA